MGRAFSILRACLDERQETCYSVLIRASTFLKYNRISFFLFCIRDALNGKYLWPGRVCYEKSNAGLGLGGWWPVVTGLLQEVH